MIAEPDTTPDPQIGTPRVPDLAATRSASRKAEAAFGDKVESLAEAVSGFGQRLAAFDEQMGAIDRTGDRMPGPSREEIDAKIALSEAQTDTKFARMDGKLDVLVSKLDALAGSMGDSRKEGASNRNAILGALLGAVLALGALAVGLLSYGDTMFGRGTQLHEAIQKEIKSIRPGAGSGD